MPENKQVDEIYCPNRSDTWHADKDCPAFQQATHYVTHDGPNLRTAMRKYDPCGHCADSEDETSDSERG